MKTKKLQLQVNSEKIIKAKSLNHLHIQYWHKKVSNSSKKCKKIFSILNRSKYLSIIQWLNSYHCTHSDTACYHNISFVHDTN